MLPRTGSQEKVPKNRFPSKAPKNRFPSKVQINKCQATYPRTVAQARFQEHWTTEYCKGWRIVLITERRDWKKFCFKKWYGTRTWIKTLDDSVAWKKAGGRRQEKWWWWWWWWRQWWWRGWMAMEMMMNDSWRESNVTYPRFHAFFVPAEGFLQGWHLSDSQNQKTCFLHSEKITQRRFYTQKPLHREGFT